MNMKTSSAEREQILSDWATASTGRTRRIAGVWGIELLKQSPGTQVESSAITATRFRTTKATAAQARRMLMGAGVIYMRPEDRRYYVA